MSGALCKRWSALGCLIVLMMSTAMVREARAQTGDDLYKKAAQEGIVNFYGTLAQINAEKILPVFEKRYRVSRSVSWTSRRTSWSRGRQRKLVRGTVRRYFSGTVEDRHADARSFIVAMTIAYQVLCTLVEAVGLREKDSSAAMPIL